METFDRLAGIGVVMALLLATPASARTVLEPGLWQNTETGIENGKPAKPNVTTECLSAKDAEDPGKTLSRMKRNSAQHCKKVEVNESGNSFSFVMRCGNPSQFSMDIAGHYTVQDRRHYSGRMKMTVVFGGRKVTSDKQMVSKWIGAACKK